MLRLLPCWIIICCICGCNPPTDSQEGLTSSRLAAVRVGERQIETPVFPRDILLRLHPTIMPRPGEAPWADVPWETDLWEARKKAAAQGKPIFVWSANGEPLGCT